MNWIDIVLLILLVAMVIVGSKKGLIRELAALIVLGATVILSINYIDFIAVKIHELLGGSPLVTAIISFVVLLAFIYAAFKLLAMMFYRIANLQKLGKKDQLGGALVGAVRGWIVIAFLVFLVFLIPMPDKFYADFNGSLFGPVVAKTLPAIYNSTSIVHPGSPDFMTKVERTLLQNLTESPESREQVNSVFSQMLRTFGSY